MISIVSYNVGDQVRHKRYGRGKILRVVLNYMATEELVKVDLRYEIQFTLHNRPLTVTGDLLKPVRR